VLVCEKRLNLLLNNTHSIASNGRDIMSGKLVGMWKESSLFSCRNMLKFVGEGGLGKPTKRRRVGDNLPGIQNQTSAGNSFSNYSCIMLC
jgi:hypothetical protein